MKQLFPGQACNIRGCAFSVLLGGCMATSAWAFACAPRLRQPKVGQIQPASEEPCHGVPVCEERGQRHQPVEGPGIAIPLLPRPDPPVHVPHLHPHQPTCQINPTTPKPPQAIILGCVSQLSGRGDTWGLMFLQTPCVGCFGRFSFSKYSSESIPSPNHSPHQCKYNHTITQSQ